MCPVMCGDAESGHGQLMVQETNLAISITLLETPRPSTDHDLMLSLCLTASHFW